MAGRGSTGTTSEFETVLRSQVTDTFAALAEVRRAGHDYEAHLHSARVRDLLDLAARHGIDTTGWAGTTTLDFPAPGD
ncbi:hypothetical protein [Actinocrispum sp. NPDC049592]|uniref:hypothetical protein n=1 Tax=Actinocrispum sp. NPDC049592 TaxID=3154835 RepID=UPI003441F662